MYPWQRVVQYLPMVLSRKSGSVSKRRVWPVGAVSKTMCWKWEYSGLLRNCTTLLMATASSMPGGKVSSSSPATMCVGRGHV